MVTKSINFWINAHIIKLIYTDLQKKNIPKSWKRYVKSKHFTSENSVKVRPNTYSFHLQVIKWMQTPTELSALRDFQDWKETCDEKGQPYCSLPNACPLTTRELPGETLRLFTCMECPNYYPWLLDPTGDGFTANKKWAIGRNDRSLVWRVSSTKIRQRSYRRWEIFSGHTRLNVSHWKRVANGKRGKNLLPRLTRILLIPRFRFRKQIWTSMHLLM